MDRRNFIASSLAGLAGAAFRPAGAEASERRPAPLGPEAKWDAVRAHFALEPGLVHLGALLLATHPAPVREAIERHRRGLDENPVRYYAKNNRRLRRETLSAAGAYFRVDPANVALTESTTMGLAMVYNGLRLEPGDEVIASRHDHWATRESLRLKAEKSGATVRLLDVYGDPRAVSADALAAAYLDAIGPRTKVLALTWVHSHTGVKLPVRRIADGLAKINATRGEADRVLLVVDGVHGFGVEDVGLADLGCDLFVAGCHKWLFGPRGTGLIFAKDAAAWDRTSPTIPRFAPPSSPGRIRTPGGFHSFEHRWALPEAFRFHETIGKDRIAARTRALAAQLKEGLGKLRHVRPITPASPDLSAGIVLFEVDGLRPTAVVRRLLDDGIVITRAPYGSRSPRITPSILNTPAEIDRTLVALRALA